MSYFTLSFADHPHSYTGKGKQHIYRERNIRIYEDMYIRKVHKSICNMYICVYTHICDNVHSHTYIIHSFTCDYICRPCQNGAVVVHLESVINHYNRLKQAL